MVIYFVRQPKLCQRLGKLAQGRIEFHGEEWKIDHGVGSIAQRLEQGTHNPLVPGSNPGGPIF